MLKSLQRSNLRPVTSTKTYRRHALVQKRDWAHEVNVNKPMKDFHKLVPDMAHKVSFCASSSVLALILSIVPLRARHLPERSSISSIDGRFCLRCRAYVCWKDCGRRVCYCPGGKAHDTVRLLCGTYTLLLTHLKERYILPLSKRSRIRNTAISNRRSRPLQLAFLRAMFKSIRRRIV